MRALVLSGGARKGAYQAGAIKHLMSVEQREYDMFVGISVGAINAAHLAQYQNPVQAADSLYSLWEDVTNAQVRKYWYGGVLWILPALWKGSVYNTSGLRKLLDEKLSAEKVKQSGKSLLVGAVSLDTGKYRVFDEGYSNLHDAVLASSAFPGFLEDVEIEGELYTDGGVKNVVPIRDAVEAGATEIDVIITGPLGEMEQWERTYNAVFKGKRVVDIMSAEIFEDDFLEYCKSCTSRIRLLAPVAEFGGDPLDFNDRAKLDFMMAQGYEDAKDRWQLL